MSTQGFPAEGMELTHILVVEDASRARDFYRDVLGAELYREYGGTSVVLRLLGTWLLLVTGGGPTADKPDVTFAPPADPRTVGRAMTIRVADCRAAYETLRQRGARFLTPPVDSPWEVRCFFRDPDGHLLELSEVKAPPAGPSRRATTAAPQGPVSAGAGSGAGSGWACRAVGTRCRRCGPAGG